MARQRNGARPRERPTGMAMVTPNTQQLNRVAAYLRQKQTESVSLSDVVALAEITAQSLQTFFEKMDAAIYRELREIADYIGAMKIELGALQVKDINENRIPAAGQELDAIVKATEQATNTIMECAESVMAADPSEPQAYKALVDDKMLVIFEACSFQDITGQRIAKVVETLQHIESRVSRFADAMRDTDFDQLAVILNEGSDPGEERKRKLMLHGPQLEGEAMKQSDVDGLMATMAGKHE
jgi:chemotaxis protein CheZ